MKKHMIPKSSRFLFSLSILSFLSLKTKGLVVLCPHETSYYNLNGTYHTNLKTLFSDLSSNATRLSGFYNSTAGRNPPDIAYGLFLCQGDLSPGACADCVTAAGKQAVQECPRLNAVIWHGNCMLRHSNESFFSIPYISNPLIYRTTQNVRDPNRFYPILMGTLNGIASRAPHGNELGKRFAVEEANYTLAEKLYSLAQCTLDISSLACSTCLATLVSAIDDCCAKARGGTFLHPSCDIKFHLYPFYNVTTAPPPPTSTVPPPPRTSTAPLHPSPTSAPPGKAGGSQIFLNTLKTKNESF